MKQAVCAYMKIAKKMVLAYAILKLKLKHNPCSNMHTRRHSPTIWCRSMHVHTRIFFLALRHQCSTHHEGEHNKTHDTHFLRNFIHTANLNWIQFCYYAHTKRVWEEGWQVSALHCILFILVATTCQDALCFLYMGESMLFWTPPYASFLPAHT